MAGLKLTILAISSGSCSCVPRASQKALRNVCAEFFTAGYMNTQQSTVAPDRSLPSERDSSNRVAEVEEIIDSSEPSEASQRVEWLN